MNEHGNIDGSDLAGYMQDLAEVQGEMAGLLAESLLEASEATIDSEEPYAPEDRAVDARRIGKSLLRVVERMENDMAEHAERWRIDRWKAANPEGKPEDAAEASETRGYAVESFTKGRGKARFAVLPPAGTSSSWDRVKTFEGATAYERAWELARLLTTAFRLGLRVGRNEARPLTDGKDFPNLRK